MCGSWSPLQRIPPTHTPTIHPMSIKCISMFLYRKQIFVILPFHFSWLNWVQKCARFKWIFVLYIHVPLSIPPTMHIVNSINSICLHFISSDSFMQWNQTDPAALSILTHSVPLVSSINFIETIYSIIFLPSVQPFKSVLYFLFQFHWYNQFQQSY